MSLPPIVNRTTACFVLYTARCKLYSLTYVLTYLLTKDFVYGCGRCATGQRGKITMTDNVDVTPSFPVGNEPIGLTVSDGKDR